MPKLSNVNFNGKDIDIVDTYARKQLTHLTADNYTADVTGDYTVNAGDISMSSANATLHTTADREINADGNDSVHVDGASTLNVGGLRTETFAGDKTETVTGTATEKFNNINTTVTGKWAVNLPGKMFDMKDVALMAEVSDEINNLMNNLKSPLYVNVKDYDVKGDGVTDDTTALQKVINENVGKTIFFPSGTYIITSSIVLPDNTTLLGENHESKLIAGADNINILTNSNYLTYGSSANKPCPRCNITIQSLTIDGHFVESPYTDFELTQPHIRNGVTGIALYGQPLRFYDVWAYNCGGNGIITVGSGLDETNTVPINEESVFLNCVVKFNGLDGWRYIGPHDAMMCNCAIGTNSRLKHNTYANLNVEQHNLRIVNSHFYSDYGNCKAKYSIVLSGAQCNICNCHIEGAGTSNMSINSPYHQISNCHIYASFGTSDVEIKSAFITFNNCLLDGPVTDQPGVTTDPWVGAFAFSSLFYNYIDCELNGTAFTDTDTPPDFHDSYIVIRGAYEGHPAIKNLSPVNVYANYISVMGSFTDTNTLILPERTTLPKISPFGKIEGFNLTNDANLTSYVSIVWGQDETKKLTLPPAKYGTFLIIINQTDKWLHLKANTDDTINNLAEGYGMPTKALIIGCGADHQWLTADVQASKPTG